MLFVTLRYQYFSSVGYVTSDSGEVRDSGDSDDNVAVGLLSKVIYRAGDFVVVKFQAKKSVVHYVAELMKMTSAGDDKEWCVKFLRKQTPSSTLKFVYPPLEQIYDVKAKDFVLKLPPPDSGVRRHILFSCDLSQYNFR